MEGHIIRLFMANIVNIFLHNIHNSLLVGVEYGVSFVDLIYPALVIVTLYIDGLV